MNKTVGKKNCSICHGRGEVRKYVSTNDSEPIMVPCSCVLRPIIKHQAERRAIHSIVMRNAEDREKST